MRASVPPGDGLPPPFDAWEAAWARPGERVLYQVHPALGMERRDDGELDMVDAARLGVAWLALPREEQTARERDMLHGLLTHAALRADGATVWLRPPRGDVRLAAALGRCAGLVARDDGAFAGSLTPAVVELAVHGDELAVACGGRPFAMLGPPFEEKARELGVWLRPGEAAALREQLTRAWWEPAQRRRESAGGAVPAPRDGGRVSRATRAWLLYAWERHGARLAALALFAALGLSQLAVGLVRALPVLAVAAALGIGVAAALARWHRRS